MIIGLTGGIGSGKSVVGKFFEMHETSVIDADVLAKQALDKNSLGFNQAIDFFVTQDFEFFLKKQYSFRQKKMAK